MLNQHKDMLICQSNPYYPGRNHINIRFCAVAISKLYTKITVICKRPDTQLPVEIPPIISG